MARTIQVKNQKIDPKTDLLAFEEMDRMFGNKRSASQNVYSRGIRKLWRDKKLRHRFLIINAYLCEVGEPFPVFESEYEN